jgi:hypothetical protein
VIAVAHPTGDNPSLSSISFSHDKDGVTCLFQVSWNGAVLHTQYLTSVAWRLNEQGHVSATLVRDSSRIAASPGTAAGLEEYFRTKLWPAVARNLGQSTTA